MLTLPIQILTLQKTFQGNYSCIEFGVLIMQMYYIMLLYET